MAADVSAAGGGGAASSKPLKAAFRTALDVVRQLPRDGAVQITQDEKFKARTHAHALSPARRGADVGARQ